MNYLLYISIVTVLFIIYVEYSVGGILWRQTSSGVKSFNFGSLFNYLIDPLRQKFLWNKELLDVNYVFVVIISSIIYYLKI
tara:strand:- start:300 stop:542 length:243 start_codon:yes stop_codon:yes gene_type:complete